MVSYWNHQITYDIALVAGVSTVLIFGPEWGLPVIVEVKSSNVLSAARLWVAPALTLLGLLCATVTFVLAVVDKPEFRFIRDVGVERQLWIAFGECIVWLGLAALFSAGLSFIEPGALSKTPWFLGLFFLLGVAVSILKFCWLMCQIISVKVSQAR